MTKRKLIPDDEIIVVLDTSPIRNLAHGAPPEWLDVFIEMSKSGYSFSLADTTAGELMVQYRSGRIPHEGYEQMLVHLEKFLNPKVPIIPGKVDVELMIGIEHETYNIEETAFIALEAWRLLQSPNESDFSIGPPFEELIEEERSEWVRFLSNTAEHTYSYGLDISKMNPDDTANFLSSITEQHLYPNIAIEPPMTTRMHLELLYRFRQMARTTLKKKPYDPRNKKKKNDGIDVDLYKYFILPALVVADDSGFFNSIENIDSFQKNWFFRPQELADTWQKGHKPKPIWPSNLTSTSNGTKTVG
ncbi:hypothetical protein [Vibrio splendidus]|uniref:hypothetical protein n=1 Tax=Vibrio splendidus TaxID=29497 RepID=UPI000C8458C2|nr:hypothetical protein [Vibrio splendidus]PMN26966.1 hypothetical protein BCT36_09295 [Vibrio splendidus]